MPSVLEKLASRLVGARGVEYATARKQLKAWLGNRPEDELIREIQTITKVEVMRALLGVGLNARLQEALRAQWQDKANSVLPIEPEGV